MLISNTVATEVNVKKEKKMKRTAKLTALLLSLVLLFGVMSATLISCGQDGADDGNDQSTPNGGGSNTDKPDDGGNDSGNTDADAKISYTVSVKTVGGRALEGVTVYIYADSSLSDIVNFGDTGKDGVATINMKRSNDYAIVLSRVPAGYDVAEYYTFTGGSANIVLTSGVIKDNKIPSRYALGDIMHDFTVTTSDGKTFTLSEALKNKKGVLINFWYSTCSPCISEFPYLDTVAQEFADDIAVICLNTYAPDTADAVRMFKATQGLSLDMAKGDVELYSAFGSSGYPTNVMIDRYGTICLVEVGGLPSEKPFRAVFEHFSADNYKQSLINSIDELTPAEKPNITAPDSDTVGGVLNSGDITVTYYPEKGTADAEYSWPFIVGEFGGNSVIKPSNAFKDSSYATIHADVTLKAGEAIAFDYFADTELGVDILYVLVNEEDTYSISGVSTDWETCYPFVAESDGVYKLTFIYVKDSYGDIGDDVVYLDNLRVVDANTIDKETYIARYCANQIPDSADYSYVNVVLGEDGYYHVGTANGPLVLADLMGYTPLSSEASVYLWAYNGEIVVGDKNYYDELVAYCSYASNSFINGLCTVNEELKSLLDVVISVKGFDKDENEWLKVCKYYDAYGTEGKQLSDPIAGLAPHSAFDTVLSTEETDKDDFYPNTVVYDRLIMPRGLWYAFTPTESGVYRITSDSRSAVNGWIFLADKTELLVYDHIERFSAIPEDSNDPKHRLNNVSMVMYFEANTTYYIDIAFYEVTEIGSFDFRIEYEAPTLELFRSVSPSGAFTYELDENGEITDTLIAGGFNVALGDDGYYHIKNSDGTLGELVYLDLTMSTGFFDKPIYTSPNAVKPGTVINDLINLGAFNFTLTEEDKDGITYLKNYTVQALRDYAVNGKNESFKGELAANISAWELEAMKLYFGSYTMQELLNFLASNKSAADDPAVIDALIKAYKDANGSDTTSEEADLKAYLDGILSNDQMIRKFYSVGKDIAAANYVKAYTNEKIKAEYVNSEAAAEMDSTVKADLEKFVDGALSVAWADEYSLLYGFYRIDDLKRGITHGNGEDLTSVIKGYVDQMISDTNNPDSLSQQAYGCVKVDAALAAALQVLMDAYSFKNVTNSWTKLCYFFEYYGPEA